MGSKKDRGVGMVFFKKICLAVTAVLVIIGAPVSAQQVMVDGIGVDKDSAMRDASRNAVEQVVGTLVNAQTLVSNAMVQLDEIYTKSQGFVTGIEVLSQRNEGGMLRIKARVEVNTDPDAQLMSRLNMIMMLNDPRIAVVILKQDSYGNVQGHDLISESALNDHLLTLGFSHVVDAGVASQLNNAVLLNQIYNGTTGISAIGSTLGADYLVIGRTRLQSQEISLPDGNGGYAPTLLKSGNAILNVKVIKFDTGEIVGTYTTSAKGVENSNEMAEQRALEKAAAEAARKLEEKFRHFSADTSQHLQLEVHTSDYTAVEQLLQDIRQVSGVQNVTLREKQGVKTVLSVDTTLKPNVFMQLLQSTSRLGFFVAGMTNNTVKMSVSRR